MAKEFAGRWALVTGASAGIGAALARELAREGANLVLTARRADRLEALARELRAQGTEVRVVVADLNDRGGPQAILDATVGMVVDVLVNNAGLGQYGAFVSSELEQELSQVRVNCEAMVHLTRLFAPEMAKRRRGWILVVASTASFQPVPYLSTYAATKAFDRFFAEALAAEMAASGVKVTALCPGPTESEFFEVAGAAKFRGRGVQDVNEVARRAVRALRRGQRTIIPNASGRLSAAAVRFLPTRWITALVERAARPTQ